MLSLVSLAIGLIAIEAGARYLARHQPRGKEQGTQALYTQYDPLLGWRKTPGAFARYERPEYATEVRINSLGLRDRERTYENPAGAFRILLLGDSFIEAFQVDLRDSISQVLESSLARGRRPVEVINAGTVGYGTDQEYLYYGSEGYRFGANVVLVFVYHNDILANGAAESSGRFKPEISFTTGRPRLANVPVPIGRPILPAPPRKVESRGSVAYDMLADRIEASAPRLYDTLSRIGLFPPLRILPISNEFDVYRREWTPEVRRAMTITGNILKALASEVGSRAGRLGVVYVPTRMEVNDRDWDLAVLRYGLSPEDWDRGHLAAAVQAWGREARFPTLDLTGAMRAESSLWRGRTYYRGDSHWNARGHRVAAREVERFLRALGWLPA